MKKICFLFLLFFSGSMIGVTIGLNDQPSREARAFLPTGVDNLMQGFAVMENGFVFEDSVTTCSFDTFFSTFGDLVLSAGTLNLLQDLDIKSLFSIGPGLIQGSGHSVTFPGDSSSIDLPTQYHTDIFSLIDTDDAAQQVNSVSWSHDDKYLAVGTNVADPHNEIQIYYFDGDVLTLTLSQDLGETIYSVRWHPHDYYLALGHSAGGNELKLYYLNVASGTLDLEDDLNTGRVNAVSWAPTGSYLAVGLNANTNFYVVEVDAGTFGTSYSTTLTLSRSVQRNAVDWDYTSSYIAVGLDENASDAELKVFYFSGAALSDNAELEVGGAVYGVKWRPESSTLAIVPDASSERLRLCEHDGAEGTLTEITSARVGDGQSSYGVDWSFDGRFLGIAKVQAASSHEFRVFCFDDTNEILSYVSGYTNPSDMNCIVWTNAGYYVATGDADGNVRLFEPTSLPLRFKDVRVFFNSNVVFRGPVIFEGTCFVCGGGEEFSFADDGAFIIGAGASVFLEHANFKGISANNVACLDDDGLLILHDVNWNQDSTYTFSVGALQFENEVHMCGDATFVYGSSQTSTILRKSILELDEGFTFSYDPGSASKTLLEFEDDTSKLLLNCATLHATVTGMQLTKGYLHVKGASAFSSETLGAVSEGITIGDQTAENDLMFELDIGTALSVPSGTLNYKNVLASSFSMACYTTRLHINSGARLNLYESMNLTNGMLYMDGGSTIGYARDKSVTGSIVPLGKYYTKNI